jgi:hypothetical protein
MTRRIITLAASALALSTFGVAPLIAQAASEAIYHGTGTTLSASVVNTVDVTNVPLSLALDGGTPFDPETGISAVDFTFDVAYNGSGYQVLFGSTNHTGAAFELLNDTTKIPYTVTGASVSNADYPYKSGVDASTPTLTEASPDFKINVAGVTGTTLSNMKAGAYSDTLTVTVTAV